MGGLKVSHHTVWRFLRRQWLPFKKNAVRLSRRPTSPGQARRAVQPGLDLRRWCSSRTPGSRPTWRSCGAKKASNCAILPCLATGRTLTFRAALPHDRLTAPYVFEGWATVGAPRLSGGAARASSSAGDIVIKDNPGSHKLDIINHAIRPGGVWHPPPYWPALEPVSRSLPGSSINTPGSGAPPWADLAAHADSPRRHPIRRVHHRLHRDGHASAKTAALGRGRPFLPLGE